MTDESEDVVKLATELTDREWRTLKLNTTWHNAYDPDLDDPLIEKGLVELKEANYMVLTDLGEQVWEWHGLFWEETP